MNIYDFSVKTRLGKEISLKDYEGKVLLIVNTATGCGFTPQYTGLQELYNKYKDKGFEILDFPCNQFANQAPGSDDEIHTFCTGRFGITFPQFGKIDVNGKNEDPLYTYLKKQKGGFCNSKIKWNFTKFLVGKDGTVLKRFAPTVTPEKIDAFVADALNQIILKKEPLWQKLKWFFFYKFRDFQLEIKKLLPHILYNLRGSSKLPFLQKVRIRHSRWKQMNHLKDRELLLLL